MALKHILIAAGLLILVSGCTAHVDNHAERYYWPPPPDTPRIEWLKTYSSQLDIEKSASQRFWVALTGEDQPISLAKPIEVKSVPEYDRFYVSDIGLSAVMVFDIGKHELRKLVTPGGITPISQPLSIVVDSEKNVFVLDRRSSAVYVFDKFEKYQRAINLRAHSISKPVAMAIDPKKKHLFIADAALRLITVIGMDGHLVRTIGSAGDAEGQFNRPVAIALNSKGELIVADAFGANVQIFDTEGRFLRKFGRRGDSIGDFQLIKSVAVDSDDNMYVVDGRSHSISIFNQHGELLLAMGGFFAVSGTGKIAPGGFSVPVGIDIDSRGRIFVVDQLNARVQVFQYLSSK